MYDETNVGRVMSGLGACLRPIWVSTWTAYGINSTPKSARPSSPPPLPSTPTMIEVEAPWAKSSDELLRLFSVDQHVGLSPEQVAKHAEIYGRNG